MTIRGGTNPIRYRFGHGRRIDPEEDGASATVSVNTLEPA